MAIIIQNKHWCSYNAFNRPAVAFESGVRLMKNPKSRDSAALIVTELILTVNGFWCFLNCKMSGKHDVSDPSPTVESDSSKLISNTERRHIFFEGKL